MDTSQDGDQFFARFQFCCALIVNTLRDVIKKDVDHSTEKTHLKKYNKYQIALPPLESFPDEFSSGYQEAIIDSDMKDDLRRSNVINWCRTTKRLLPLKTTADGNCLLHAISQALWGIEDSENFLRRLVYMNIVVDVGGQFKKRWLFHQRTFLQSANTEFRLNTEEHNVEWDSVIKATDDLTSPESHGLPYKTLEAIHLYVIANTLKRPIIVLADNVARNVYGQSMQESHIGGIYLPLGIAPQQCHKSPLVIAYSMNHFAPLVFEQDKLNGSNEMQAVPLVTKSFVMLECKFLLPDEEAKGITSLLQNYLNLKEVVFDAVPIPVALLNHSPLPETVNVVDAYRKDCEAKLRRIMNQDMGYVGMGDQPHVPPFNFQTKENDRERRPNPNAFVLPAGGANLPQDFDRHGRYGPFRQEPQQEHCCTVSCPNLADPNLQGLCSRCFKDFTIQYAKQEEAKRKIQQGHLPIQPGFQRLEATGPNRPAPRREQPTEQFYDLSMMGEDCHAKCGFKCALETYPYCHECHPKYVGAVGNQPMGAVATGSIPGQPELSMMPDECSTYGCRYKCSKATAPYCHECYERNRPPVLAPPTAPPPSVPILSQPRSPTAAPTVRQPTSPRFQTTCNDETAVVSLRDRTYIQTGQPNYRPSSPVSSPRPLGTTGATGHQPMDVDRQLRAKNCQTIGCYGTVEKGNDGYCDNCYQLTLYGNTPGTPIKTGSSPGSECSTPNCTNFIEMPHMGQCKSCFIEGKPLPFNGTSAHLLSGGRAELTRMNIPTMEEKIINQTPNHPHDIEMHEQPFNQMLNSMQSVPTEHDETEVLAPNAVGLQIQKHAKYDSGTYQKHICATAGCSGIRLMEPHGLCLSCQQGHGPQVVPEPEDTSRHAQESGNMENSDPYVSESPCQLTKEQIRKLNPVVLSSKDKVKCSYTSCKNMIYPPKKLCESCTKDLDIAKSKKSRQQSKELADIGIEGDRQKCKAEGCQFYGTKENDGYCSSCKKGYVALPRTNNTVPMANPSRSEDSRRNYSAPVMAQRQIEVVQSPLTPQPTPSTSQTSTNPRRGNQCLEKGCTRFGDPKQGYRCSQHYMAAARNTPPITQESIEQLRPHVYPNAIQGASGNMAGFQGAGYRPTTGNNITGTNFMLNQPPYGQATDQNMDQFKQVYGKLETSRKSTNVCRNNSAINCKNYGNSAKGGYCNTCYENMQYRPH